MWKCKNEEMSILLAATLLIAQTAQTPPASQTPQPPAQEYAGVDKRPPNAKNQKPARPDQTRAPEAKSNVAFDVVTLLRHTVAIMLLPHRRWNVSQIAMPARILDLD